MDQWFVIGLGLLVAALYVPSIVMPARHRELAKRLAMNAKLRPFGLAMMAVGIAALLLGNQSDVHHRILFAFGIIEIASGMLMLGYPAFFESKVQWLCSKPIWYWIARGTLKFAFAVVIVGWGIVYF